MKGYYGYMWSLSYSYDLFYTKFKASPMDNATGRKYRDVILAAGGSREEEDILREFLGRPPSSDAFLKELGIVAKL